MEYSREELVGIYELGRMYLEMGYFTPAERIFSGLVVVDQGQTPARLALGLVKLERGLYQESLLQLRSALQQNSFPVQAKLGLVAAFVATKELQRAKSMLNQIQKDHGPIAAMEHNLRALWEAFSIRCGGVSGESVA